MKRLILFLFLLIACEKEKVLNHNLSHITISIKKTQRTPLTFIIRPDSTINNIDNFSIHLENQKYKNLITELNQLNLNEEPYKAWSNFPSILTIMFDDKIYYIHHETAVLEDILIKYFNYQSYLK